MVKHLIKEISEKEFRALNLKVYRHERILEDEKGSRFGMAMHYINDILDEEIKYALDSGYEQDLEYLTTPLYIAIHEENNEEYSGYLDKFMNRYTGLQTFQIGWGIKHLYSTRDYYEDHEDYWRVNKKETAVIYKITLDSKWLKKFILKHKTITTKINDDEYIETYYNLLPNGEWEKTSSYLVTKKRGITIMTPIKEKEA